MAFSMSTTTFSVLRERVLSVGAVLLSLTLLFSLVSMALADGGGAPRSSVVFPRQEIPLHFSHTLHLTKVDASCDDCHEEIADSGSSLDNNLPGEEVCRMCHSIDRAVFAPAKKSGPAGDCAACHVGFDPAQGAASIRRVSMPVPNLKFSHKAHLARKAKCSTCHGNFTEQKVTLASRDQLPTMKTCLGCHDGKTAPSRCTTCHLSSAGGVVRTSFPQQGSLRPSGALRGAAHDLNFRTSHKYAAQNDSQFCASCHKKDFCSDCHNGVSKPMDFHVGDYVALHPIDARRNSQDCSSCHRLQTFCQGCHSRMGVAVDGRSDNLVDGANFHPEGWVEVGLAGRGPRHHSFQAQRNIKQCASCHREDTCTRCHSNQFNSRSISPHPRNWRGSRRCEALLKRSKRMCLRCHTEDRQVSCSR